MLHGLFFLSRGEALASCSRSRSATSSPLRSPGDRNLFLDLLTDADMPSLSSDPLEALLYSAQSGLDDIG